MRLRSIVSVVCGSPPSEEVLASATDGVLLSVSDGDVDIETARRAAVDGVKSVHEAGKVALVRVNHPRTHLLRDDLEWLVGPALAGVFLPHSVTPQDARDTAVILRELELQREMEPGETRIFPVIDTARGLLRCEDMADAAPRVGGLVFDDDGYAADVMGRPEENGPRMAYARGRVVAAARAFDRLPLAISHGLETRFLAQHGFAGTVIEEPRLSDGVNTSFTPSHSTLERARRHRDTYSAARAEGAWVARAGVDVADAHSARKAAQAIEAAGETEG